jgi:hypothetical protein
MSFLRPYARACENELANTYRIEGVFAGFWASVSQNAFLARSS